jgi:hypothetical protein
MCDNVSDTGRALEQIVFGLTRVLGQMAGVSQKTALRFAYDLVNLLFKAVLNRIY